MNLIGFFTFLPYFFAQCRGCVVGYLYCGHESALSRWDNVQSHRLYRCSAGGTSAEFVADCNLCIAGGNSHCSCTLGKEYCGHELNSLPGWSSYYTKNAIYRCSHTFSSELVKICRGECLNGACRENCASGGTYCGHELVKLEGWENFTEKEKQSLYRCTTGSQASYVTTCNNMCITGNPSFCSCMSDVTYCGYELNGYSNLQSNTLYKCSYGGTASHVKTCLGRCVMGSPSFCHQNCDPGKYYCGHELGQLENWSVSDEDKNILYQCTSGSSASPVTKCPKCISGNPSHCSCKSDLKYCGYELNRMIGWTGYDSNTLYKCSSSGESVTTSKTCLGSCVEMTSSSICSQDCRVGSYYCGDELGELEGWEVAETQKLNMYRCTNGSNANFIHNCNHACIRSNPSYCSCKPNYRYCGHELQNSIGYSHLQPNNIYECKDGGSTVSVKSCQGICREGQAVCVQNCHIGKYYCGHELSQLEGWLPDSIKQNWLYFCSNGTNANPIKECKAGCNASESNSICQQECVPGLQYCGSLLNRMGWLNVSLTALYYCKDVGEIEFVKQCQKFCIETQTLATCDEQCIEGTKKCGYQLHDIPTLIDVDAKYIYVCRGGTYIKEEKCSYSCNGTLGAPFCHRECMPGGSYCGNVLQRLGWPNINSNTLYRCTTWTGVPETKQVCKHECSDSICKRECHKGSLYCGHELHQLGFEGGVAHSLYLCSNSESQIEINSTCEGICVAHQDQSYCSDKSHRIRSCGVEHSKLMIPFIREGKKSQRTKWPWMAAIQENRYNFRYYFCGGTLIHPKWVLTAAHCLENIDSIDNIKVVLGDHQATEFDKGQITINVTKIIPYQKYDRLKIASGDIALLKLEHNVDYSTLIYPACLPDSKKTLEISTSCVIVGWGKTEQWLNPNILQEGNIEIFNDSYCANAFTGKNKGCMEDCIDFNFDKSSMICAGKNISSAKLDSVSCNGDSGGPLLCEDFDGSWTIYGITSYGKEQTCNISYIDTIPAAYTKVSSFLTWIYDQIENEFIESGPIKKFTGYEKDDKFTSENGQSEKANLLLSKGGDIDAKDEDTKSALYVAAHANGHTGSINLLLSKDADTSARDEGNKTALHYASEDGHTEVPNLLKSNVTENEINSGRRIKRMLASDNN